MSSYHFSCGNSTKGTVGLCARVSAGSSTQALAKLRRALEGATGAAGELPLPVDDPAIEYINVYLSPEHISTRELDSN